jgi:uncharacterized protein (DUF1501 family)
MELNRRRFLLLSGTTAATCLVQLNGRAQSACPSALPFVITIQASGAWDPTFLVDPVADDAGFTPFTAAQILQQGEIRYAPYTNDTGVVTPYGSADGQDFFVKHGSRLVVFNGVDNATVSHDVGPRIAFTGSTRDGQPTLSGLVAGLQGANLPLAMFVAGGYASTGGLVPVTRGGSLQLLQGLADPNRDGIHSDAVETLLQTASRNRDARLIAESTLPRTRQAFQQILDARSGPLEERFREIAGVLESATGGRGGGGRNDLTNTAAGVLALMRAGATAAAHLSTGGFDTHDNHDDLNNGQRPALARLLTGIDSIIDTAVADPTVSTRGLVILVASDFGRTKYNDGGGKDHWPITSMMAIGVGAAEALVGGGQVIGGTTPDGQNGVNALRVKRDQDRVVTVEGSDPSGFRLTPAHVHHAMRSAIGLCESGLPDDPLRRFALNVLPPEPIPFG